ncbi:MFS general substrate transporter [Pleurostoma richardsiae]|uniref:MFS general substrate transporter n=1 Tax=Pleurostoma richardsiae TaxID=41990 RepID=A0AA38RFX0_9PEZI|nr:MFS general substrate transporter [Pleurostoma richardsiae]
MTINPEDKQACYGDKSVVVDTVTDEETAETTPATTPRDPKNIPLLRGTPWQALVVAAVFFCGPGMYSALNALGAGGLRDPHLVNITSAMGYALTAVFSFFGGVVINVLGLRGVLSVGLVSFSLNGAALYCKNKFDVDWFLYFASAVSGFCAAVLWIAQGAITLAYPEPGRRGLFITTFYSSISIGALVGGIIALAFNVEEDGAGSITPISYIPLITISACGPFVAWLLAPPTKVIRTDGLPVKVKKQASPWQEAKKVFGALKKKEILLLVPLFIYSQWFLSWEGNFVAVYHSVRGRALGGFLSSVLAIFGNLAFYVCTDRLGWTRREVVRRGFYIIFTLNSINWVYATVVQKIYADTHPVGLDWTQGEYWLSIVLYLYWSFVNNAFQCYMYFLVGTLSDEVEELARYTSVMKTINTAGIALGYGVQVKWSMMGSEALICGLWFIQIIPTWFVVRAVEDDVKAELSSTGISSDSD